MTKPSTLVIIAAITMAASINAQQYTVELEPNKAKREVIEINPGPVTANLTLYPKTPWRIGGSRIVAPTDDFLWSGPWGWVPDTPPDSLHHMYLLLNAHSSREYVKIEGNLVQNGAGNTPPPWFRITVPAVDIDWAGSGYETNEDETREDTNKLYCAVTSEMSQRRKLLIRNPLAGGRMRDDSDLLGSTPDMRLTLNSGYAGCFMLLKADGSTFNTGIFRLQDFSAWPLELYVDALPDKPPSDLEIILEGPAGPDGMRTSDRITGSTVVSVTLDNDLWWFDGANPGGGYHVQATLKATPDNGLFQWHVITGTTIVTLNNGGTDADTITASNDNNVTVKSIGASSSLEDVTITLTYNGVAVCNYNLTVRKPGAPQLLEGFPTNTAIFTGFMTKYRFQIFDQLGAEVPFDMPVNESFGDWTSDWQGELWGTPQPNGVISASFNGIKHTFYDDYALILGYPAPVNPSHTDANDKVQHSTQSYRAGSTTPGVGILIMQHTLQFYRGKAQQQ